MFFTYFVLCRAALTASAKASMRLPSESKTMQSTKTTQHCVAEMASDFQSIANGLARMERSVAESVALTVSAPRPSNSGEALGELVLKTIVKKLLLSNFD